MGKFYFLLLSISFHIIFTSCKKDQDAPAYVYIPEIKVQTNYNINGSSSSKITHVKVFNGSKIIGVYELPINVPVIGQGVANIQCIPLIENNGLTANILQYIFYTASQNEIFLESDVQDTIKPIVSYVSTNSADYWFEDFNGISFDFVAGANSNAPLEITENPSEVFEGNGSGKFDLSSDTAYSKYLSEENFIYNSGKPAFLELNYKNNQAFFFSVILHSVNGSNFKLPIFQFTNTYNTEGDLYWNKIYIDLATPINALNNIESFEICFEMERDIAVSDPIVLIDNVKVILGK
jgi:hypothetical protein